MDINQLLFFDKHEATKAYCTVVNDLGQVYYCEADEEDQADGNWKLVNLDLQSYEKKHDYWNYHWCICCCDLFF